MRQATQTLTLLPPSAPSLAADRNSWFDYTDDSSPAANLGTPARMDPSPAAGSAACTHPASALAASPGLRIGLGSFVAAAHLAGLVVLTHLAQDRPTPAELAPLQVALIAAEPVAQPAPEPAPVPPEPAPPEPPPPEVRPPDPVPPPPKPVVKKHTPKPVAKRPAPVVESQTALSATEEAAPPPAPAPPAAAAPAAAAAAPAAVTAARFDAAYLNNPRPTYPALSRRLREEGQVTLRVLVSPDGLPAQVELRTSSGSDRLDRAARDAVAHWRFVPARRGETAIESWVLVPVVFKLQGN